MDAVEARRRTHVAVLTVSSMVCGGMVAAIGPSIDSFSVSTGLDEAGIGLAIMHNRIAKLIGLGLWTLYANALQRGGGYGLKPRTLMAGCMLATSMLSLAIAHVHSSVVLRASLAIFGVCYGIVDSASLQLAIWSSDSLDKSRLSVATVSAGFTVGATVAPIVVAAALKMGGSAHPGFTFLALLGALGMALFLGAPPLPTGPMRQAALVEGSKGVADLDADGKGERRGLLGGEAEAEEGAACGPGLPGGAVLSGGAVLPLGVDDGRGRRRPSVLVPIAISVVLFCLTSVEHAVATQAAGRKRPVAAARRDRPEPRGPTDQSPPPRPPAPRPTAVPLPLGRRATGAEPQAQSHRRRATGAEPQAVVLRVVRSEAEGKEALTRSTAWPRAGGCPPSARAWAASTRRRWP